MVAVPKLLPVTTPLDDPTVATPALLLVQVPPGLALVNVVDEPTHIVDAPEMDPGVVTTVTVWVAKQPPLNV